MPLCESVLALPCCRAAIPASSPASAARSAGSSCARTGCCPSAGPRSMAICRAAASLAVTGEAGASLGFAACLAGRLQRQSGRPVVWVSARPELYGPGLLRLGLDPARLLLVRATRPSDLLWALEEALRTP